MDLKSIKESIVNHVYHISTETKVPLHKHDDKDEIFYCIEGSGFGVLEDSEVTLNVGDAFIVSAGTLHSLRSEGELYVTATLVPVVNER
jgi:AraC family transcriptional activator of pobA